MHSQIGEIIGWLAKGMAILTLLGTAFIVFVFNENQRFVTSDAKTYWTIIVGGSVIAAMFFLFGQIVRYVLTRNK
jgi:Na+-driven multidrug efflux pump